MLCSTQCRTIPCCSCNSRISINASHHRPWPHHCRAVPTTLASTLPSCSALWNSWSNCLGLLAFLSCPLILAVFSPHPRVWCLSLSVGVSKKNKSLDLCPVGIKFSPWSLQHAVPLRQRYFTWPGVASKHYPGHASNKEPGFYERLGQLWNTWTNTEHHVPWSVQHVAWMRPWHSVGCHCPHSSFHKVSKSTVYTRSTSTKFTNRTPFGQKQSCSLVNLCWVPPCCNV